MSHYFATSHKSITFVYQEKQTANPQPYGITDKPPDMITIRTANFSAQIANDKEDFYLWNGYQGERVIEFTYSNGGSYKPTYPADFKFNYEKEEANDEQEESQCYGDLYYAFATIENGEIEIDWDEVSTKDSYWYKDRFEALRQLSLANKLNCKKLILVTLADLWNGENLEYQEVFAERSDARKFIYKTYGRKTIIY